MDETIRILHITDYHFRGKSQWKGQQKTVVSAQIRTLKEHEVPDLVVFSGDLVYSGSEDFFEAGDSLFGRLTSELGIPSEKIVFCPGNHDVDRAQWEEMAKKYVGQIGTVDELNAAFQDQRTNTFKMLVAPIEKFTDFAKEYYGSLNVSIDPLHSVHVVYAHSKKIGIVTINSALASYDSAHDSGQLLFPVSVIENALERIKDCSLRFLVMHHPLAEFKEFNRRAIEDVVFNNFHCLFTGHMHRKSQSLQVTGTQGLFCSGGAAVLCHEQEGRVGFSCIDIHPENLDLSLRNYIYVPEDTSFYASQPIHAEIPMPGKKRAFNELRKKAAAREAKVSSQANEIFLANPGDDSQVFERVFVSPRISEESPLDAQFDRAGHGQKPQTSVDVGMLRGQNSRFLLFGPDKCGKTALLLKIELDDLKSFARNSCLPLYVDLAPYYKKDISKLNILRLFRDEYGLHNKDIQLEEKFWQVRLLIDNYDPSQIEHNERLTSQIKEFKGICALIMSLNDRSRYQAEVLGKQFEAQVVHFHELGRSQLRALITRWPGMLETRREDALEKVTAIFKQLSIPFSFWNVSLFLWVYSRSQNLHLQNNVDLIDVYIDRLLGKEELARDSEKLLSFKDYKAFLTELAKKLYREHEATDYSVSYSNLVQFAENYKNRNPRMVAHVSDLLDFIKGRGVLIQKGDGLHTFRLNGVFEYFLALAMMAEDDFLDDIVSDESRFASFGNELEIYAEFRPDDAAYLQKVYDRVKHEFDRVAAAHQTNPRIELSLQEVCGREIEDVQKIANAAIREASESLQPLDEEQRDAMADSLDAPNGASVRRKEAFESNIRDADHLTRSLRILGRVYRNLNQIQNMESELLEILEFIVYGTGKSLIYVLQEFRSAIAESDGSHSAIEKIFAYLLPSITENMLQDAVAHRNLQRLLDSLIVRETNKRSPDEYLLFLYTLLLVDIYIEATEAQDRVDSLIDRIRNRHLLESVRLKLYYWLLFRGHGRPALIRWLEKAIKKVSKILDPKIKDRVLDRKLSEFRKRKLGNRIMEGE